MRFRVSIEPIGKQRPRACIRGKHASVYTPSKTLNYENAIRYQFKRDFPNHAPTAKPISVSVKFGMPCPKSAYWPVNAKHNGELRDGWIGSPHAKKPDLDNLMKAVLDALNGLAWVDDSQIYSLSSTKTYSPSPFIEVTIEE